MDARLSDLRIWMQNKLRADHISVNPTVEKGYQLYLMKNIKNSNETALDEAYSILLRSIRQLDILTIEEVKVKRRSDNSYTFKLYYAPIDRTKKCNYSVVPKCTSRWWYSV